MLVYKFLNIIFLLAVIMFERKADCSWVCISIHNVASLLLSNHQESDHLSRLHESVTRMLIYRLLHHPDQDGAVPDWLNPTEVGELPANDCLPVFINYLSLVEFQIWP